MSERLSRRYALALLASYTNTDAQKKALDDLKSIVQYFAEEPLAWKLMTHPLVNKKDKRALIHALTATFDQHIQSFLQIMLDHGRLSLFNDIVLAYERLYQAQTGHLMADVYVARPLEPQLKEKIKQTLEQYFSRHIEIKETVDPKVLGGLVITVDDQRFDGSIRGAIERFKSTLAI
ncbi:MAG: ATP synthase delta chain [Candidatus Carbobacillus altaicus]|uniref:ATP synthase subunit delta n=1 Tax=Candidatus Carbonibacillus altaicus TaxID=2163959 RepID=A0A2R6Y423_9BACL|nr:MAG: ATP synthase delta chain [Candidatus Carbobacillus altaicus]